jgi:chaperonin GroES
MTILIPLENYVIVEPIEAEEKSASGIIVASQSKEKPSRGKIISV